ncbi:MAG: polysaccharide biosynthesis C-terminal domain-containing protein, partial [Butyricicoccaceae bacterium]
AHSRQDLARQTELTNSVLRLTMMICLPCGAGLSVLSGPILHLLYPMQPRAVMTAQPLLFVLGFAVPLVGLATVTTAVLQASGKETVPVVTMTAGGLVKLLMGYLLLPQYGIEIIPFTTIAGYGLIAACNLFVLARRQRIRLLAASGGSAAATVGMASAAVLIYHELYGWIQSAAATLIAVCGAAGIYMILLVLLGAIRYDDIVRLPGGEKAAALLRLSGRHKEQS